MTHAGGTHGRAFSRRGLLGATVGGLTLAGSAALLAGCDGAGDGTTGDGTTPTGEVVSWQSWSNSPAEGDQHRRFSEAYQKRTGTKVDYQILTGSYADRLASQLTDETAPDAFYLADTSLAPLVAKGQIAALDDFLASPDAGISFGDTFAGLSGWCRGIDGKVYAIPVDCNPKVMWFNKVVLDEAGVDQDPAAAFDAGRWTQDACGAMFDAVTKSGRQAAVLEGSWFDTLSWLTTFGATAFDDVGKAVFDTDARAMAAAAWLIEQLRSGSMLYERAASSTASADFYRGRLATLGSGRWELPNVAKLPASRMGYDIAPLPSADGQTVAPVGVYAAAMAVNAAAKNRVGAQKFLAYYCGGDGMRQRLTAAGELGNAVPTRAGLDETVTAVKKPKHAQVFLAAARVGYATPVAIARDPDKADRLADLLDSMLLSEPLKSLDAATFLTTYANFLNAS